MDEVARYRDRVRGSLVGGAIGDALGYPIEFLALAQIREAYGTAGISGYVGRVAGQITDDTQMTLFTAEGLLRCPVDGDPIQTLRAAYLRWLTTQQMEWPNPRPDGWLASQPFLYASRAPGNACMSGLTRQQHGYVAPRWFGMEGSVNPTSKGCGTVMRSAAFGLVRSGPAWAFETAGRAAQLTHGHPTGYIAAGAFAAIIDLVVAGAEVSEAVAVTIGQLAAMPNGGETLAALERAVRAAEHEPSPERVESVGLGWVAEECLAVAVYCGLVAARTADVRLALLLSVNHSGDSDSTGAVAGNLLGARYGEAALPPELAGVIEGREVIAQVAEDLVTVATRPGRSEDLLRRYPVG
ncbi:ADP-ribosylglycohydrolase family protein [Nocardia panacis]|uniref:ADP-ribosylglycohydrolase family protein n=1 Tax=Nocardia panacis TaxID=2340916 RepID=UPI001EEF8C4D|nr:ADP-ribosylglycohydrolase family protein [Nocardia panacis]